MLYSPGLSPREQVKHVEGSEEPEKLTRTVMYLFSGLSWIFPLSR